VKALALALAVIFFIVAFLYLFGILQFGSHHHGRHLAHFILFAVLGLLSLVWMRFASKSSAVSLR